MPRPAQEQSTAFLDADRARLSVTVPRRMLDKLEAARDALAHVIGGEQTVENLRIACRQCNLLAARQAFGDTVVDRYARRKGRLHGSASSATTGAGPPAPLATRPMDIGGSP